MQANPRANPPRVATLGAARSQHRFGVKPVSRVGSHPSEMIIWLGLIEIARIKAKAVSGPQFPVVDVTYVKAARTPIRGGVVMAQVDNCRSRQFGGSGRDWHSPYGSSGHCPHHNC